ncbi:hypothetical protein EB796_016159 [Bugula neritina]|uniref:Integrase catalytic domain-containing protein n=1 Tax=Bugula neritina TaxID=10212 RepID=A0A7J7JJ40_BUGNE|nr:hypothetical protein EB796_016159 [Bugula neritina]
MQTAIRPAGITDKFLKFSTWSKLVRSIRVIRSIHRNEKKTWCVKPCSAKSLHEAETKIISAVQQSHYKEDYSTVKQGQQLSKSKPLAKLNPFIDGAGIMRVGGRLQRSQVLSYEEKHPIILPRDAHVTSLIVRHYHNSIYHLGRTSTLSAIRTAGYWVVGATRLVKSMLSKCVTCNRLRGKPITQIMSMLPTERLNPTPPFTNIGIDCFGPFTVKDRRSEVKRWGLLVTCMYSRAVHIELLPDMTTDSFLNALRTLICIRGAINIIYCDRGTNFVGADNELTREFHAMDQGSSALTTFLKENRITFQFNAPHSSHAGGVWERQIRSVRSVLEGMKSTGKYNRLDTPGLRTAFYEAMATVNSRPLAINSLNDPEAPILTPNHLLTSKSRQIGPPPGEFETTEIYGRKMWRKAQQFAEEFWRLWKVEYMQQITKRQRWEHQTRDVHTGDLVMLIEENVLRNEWPYGLVKETLRSADGRVRRVKVKTNAGTILERPIQKLVLLQEQE